MARIPNRLVRQDATTAPRPEDGKDAASGIADSYALGWMGQLKDQRDVMQANTASGPRPDGWDPLDHIPEGYEEHAAAFTGAANAGGVEAVRRNIDENYAIRNRQSQRSWGSNLLSDLGAGIADPVNVVPIPGLAGRGLLAGAARGALAIGGVNAATEIVRGSLDPTSTTEENLWGIGAGFALGGLVGGVAGKFGRAAATAAAPKIKGRGPKLDPEVVTFFRNKGYTPQQSRGIAAGVLAESGAGAERAVNPDSGAMGLGQHLGPRKQALIQRFGPNPTKQDQLEFLHWELQGGDAGGRHVLRATTEQDVMRNYITKFMRPAKGAETTGDIDRGLAALGQDGAQPNPSAAIDELEGVVIPQEVDLDGRGVKVVVGPTGGEAPARFVRAKTVAQIVDEEVGSTRASHAAGDDIADGVTESTSPVARRTAPPGPYDDWAGMSLKQLQESAAAKAADEGLAGADALRRAKKIMVEAREAIVGRTKRAVQAEGDDAAADAAAAVSPARAQQLARNLRERALRAEEAGAPDDVVDSLHARADDLEDGVTGDSALAGEGEDLVSSRERYRNGTRYDEGRAEIQAQDSEAMARAFDDGELADDLPFGMGHADGEGAAGGDVDHIVIDVDRIRASYADKPWTTPRIEGVTPFAEDSFPNVGDWLNFVFLHEREHTLNFRKEGETLAAYENRVNARAWDDLQAGKKPFTPDGGRLARLAIAPTPRGQVARLVKDQDAAIHRSISDLADDMGVGMVGKAPAGGSVFQRAQRWLYHNFTLRQSVRESYLQMLGKATGGGRIENEAKIAIARAPFIGATSRGQMGFQEFRNMVGRAIVDPRNLDAVPPQARQAAQVFNEAMRKFEEAGSEVGIWSTAKSNAAKLRRFDTRITKGEQWLKANPNGDAAAATRAQVDQWKETAEALRSAAETPPRARGEDDYFPRYWNVGAIRDNRARLEEILTEAYRIDGHADPENAAKGAVDTIISEPHADVERLVGRPSSTNARSIPVTNREVFDFIVQDPEIVMGIYSRRMGAAIEMSRRFGDTSALDEADDVALDLVQRGVPEKERHAAMQVYHDMVDRVAGGFHGKDPMSWDNRTVRFLKNVANLATMGSVIKSQVSDAAHVISVHGPRNTMRGILSVMAGDLARVQRGSYAKLSGEAMELVMARTNARIIEHDDAILVTGERGLEKWAARAQPALFTANLMMPFTVMLKELSGVMSAHSLIDDARAIAASVADGSKPDAKLLQRLKGLGVDAQDAQLLAAMPVEQTPSGLHLPNISAWPDDARGARARELFLGAVNGDTARAITTPGPLDKPAIFDGVFHSRKGREEALAQIPPLQEERTQAARIVSQLVNAGTPENDPELVAALEALQEVGGRLWQARRRIGVAGRIEAPFASLPFQMHSFAVASGGKILQGLLTGRDRARFASYASLMAAGAMATWLKTSDKNWDQMGYGELAARSFDNSSLGAWMTDLGKSLDTMLDDPIENAARSAAGMEPAYDRPGIADQVGAAGVVPGLVTGLIEPFVRNDMGWNDQVSAIRRILPMQNLIGIKALFSAVEHAARTDDAQPPAAAAAHPMARGDGTIEPDMPLMPGEDSPALNPGEDLILPDATLEEMIARLPPKKKRTKAKRERAHIMTE